MIIDVYFRAQPLKKILIQFFWESLNPFIMALSRQCNGVVGIFHMMQKSFPQKSLKVTQG